VGGREQYEDEYYTISKLEKDSLYNFNCLNTIEKVIIYYFHWLKD
jgi:hypothetical protein